ncbi:MAG: alpha amylase C-terminal domain-containing protein, partial [Verrucomicrobia bacterium]|nr:alpha amylase C-terminal domain-containing protein [Verrucomicrobiota bacterium]
RVGVPIEGSWKEVFNSDSSYYGGSNLGNGGSLTTCSQPCHGRPFSLSLTLPPLAVIMLPVVNTAL